MLKTMPFNAARAGLAAARPQSPQYVTSPAGADPATPRTAHQNRARSTPCVALFDAALADLPGRTFRNASPPWTTFEKGAGHGEVRRARSPRSDAQIVAANWSRMLRYWARRRASGVRRCYSCQMSPVLSGQPRWAGIGMPGRQLYERSQLSGRTQAVGGHPVMNGKWARDREPYHPMSSLAKGPTKSRAVSKHPGEGHIA
jgi:hypothetical protein